MPNTASQRSGLSNRDPFAMSPRVGAADLDAAEACGAGAVPRPHHLFRLAFAAVGNAPERPVFGPGDGRACIPELCGNATVARVLQHAYTLSAADLPADFAAELEVVALVVNGPAPVGFHVNAIAVEDLFEALAARLQAHVGHADERQARPAIRAHAAVRARLANRGGSLPRGHV